MTITTNSTAGATVKQSTPVDVMDFGFTTYWRGPEVVWLEGKLGVEMGQLSGWFQAVVLGNDGQYYGTGDSLEYVAQWAGLEPCTFYLLEIVK